MSLPITNLYEQTRRYNGADLICNLELSNHCAVRLHKIEQVVGP